MSDETNLQKKKTLRERRRELWKARVLKARLKGEKPPKYGPTTLTKIKILLHRLNDQELGEVLTAIESVSSRRAKAHAKVIADLIPYCQFNDEVIWISGMHELVKTIWQHRSAKRPYAITTTNGTFISRTYGYLHSIENIPAAAARKEAERQLRRTK